MAFEGFKKHITENISSGIRKAGGAEAYINTQKEIQKAKGPYGGTSMGSEEYYEWREANPERAKLEDLMRKAKGEYFEEYGPPDPYRISEETKQIVEGYKEGADIVRGQGEEMLDVAEAGRGMVETPGAGLGREAMEESTAAAVSSAQMAGGASVGALGAVAGIQAETVSGMRDQAIQTQMFRDQKEKEYRQALMDRGGSEVAALQMEAQGMQEMLRAKEQQYQVNILDPFYAEQQADLQRATAEAAQSGGKFDWGEGAKNLFSGGIYGGLKKIFG